MIESIVFDFDGVLVESLDIKTKAFGQLFESEGSEVARQIVQYHVQNMGKSRLDKFKHIYAHILKRPLGESEFEDLCRRFSSLVLEKVVEAPSVSGALEFLRAYSDSFQCFVASATPHSEIEEIVKKRGMSGFFCGVFGAPTTKKEIVRLLIDGKKISTPTSVFVGDALADYSAATENGLYFIARLNHTNERIFDQIECPKIKDLKNLHNEINHLPTAKTI